MPCELPQPTDLWQYLNDRHEKEHEVPTAMASLDRYTFTKLSLTLTGHMTGKVNRRGFFDRDLFRPFSAIPDEARELLVR